MMDDIHRRQDRANREMKNMIAANVFYCQICDVRCTSEMNLKMHFLGLKHKKNEETFKNVPGPTGHFKSTEAKTFNPAKQRVPTIDSHHSYGSSLLEQHLRQFGIQDPLIGLNYVIEYQTERSPDPAFFCELCNCRGGFSSFMSHLLGYKHRLHYMAKVYPDALQLDGAKLKQSELNALVKEKAEFIEKIDGRGKVKVILDDARIDLPGGSIGKRATDNYGQLDSRSSRRENLSFGQNMNAASSISHEPRMARSQDSQSRRENFGSSFDRVNMESSSAYDPRRLRSQDGQSGNFSRYENFGSSFGQHGNMGNSSSYESRMPHSQDYRSSGEVMHDDWRKKIKSEETFNMGWSGDNIRDTGDDYRRGEPMRSNRNDYTKGTDVDDRWMQNELEPHRSGDSKTAYTNEELFEYLQHFQITSDSDASFALKVTQSLTDGLMEYRLKTMTGLNHDKRPQLDEELRQPPGMPDERSRYESHMPRPGMQRPGMQRPGMQRPGMQRPGLQRPGLQRPGLQRPDLQRPGLPRPDLHRPGPGNSPRYTGGPADFRPKYKVGGGWKKAVTLQSKASNKKPGFQSNRRPLKPGTLNPALSKSKRSGILTPHLLKAVRGMDISRATKTLAKLSKTNPALKGVKVSVLVNVLVEAGVLKNVHT
ncbi:uncharacterized protein LOC119966251 [Scyliorhinus canicula]|uniref:uncharacterized protein LOC119966251 n=1 Tax=Scyliorhinus canicula TaxID=7830 RepID=UPI0018F2C0CE|nr:uncharacterized protein LOC119966251 [Scyliorhinus canicula]XP_038653541.1 uncharacterized protein LOC119966251 [Scyliorhinus canicula]